MEETKDTEIPTTTISESSDQEEKSSEPVSKKAKRVLSEKQRAILSLGREKARANRENKTKAKLDGMLEEYLKQKSEESKTKPQKKQKTQRVATPPPPSPSKSSTAESLSEDGIIKFQGAINPPDIFVKKISVPMQVAKHHHHFLF